jgi:hypothetical protein
MPKICRIIATQKIVGSCDTWIGTGELIKRAVADGVAREDELEEIIFKENEVDKFKDTCKADSEKFPRPPDPPDPDVDSFVNKMKALGFTKQELEAMFPQKKGKIK